jgi:hypothetical protein
MAGDGTRSLVAARIEFLCPTRGALASSPSRVAHYRSRVVVRCVQTYDRSDQERCERLTYSIG